MIRVTVGASDLFDLDSLTIELAAGGAGGTGAGGAGGGGAGGEATGGADTGGHGVGGAGDGGSSTGGSETGGVGSGGTPAVCPASYDNPVIWEDLPDLEIIRVGDTYYYTASTFHHSPGAPVLRSYDLVNWEYIGHSVPVLDFDASYDLGGSRAYVNGIWASSLRYRESNQTFYWIGCMHNVGGGYVFTATSPEGPWAKHSSQKCYYDVGLLIDDDDTMYVAYGNSTITVAQLTADGFGEVRSQQVFTSPSDIGALEGSRFYKIEGRYYIFVTQYANGEYVLRSTSGPFGPYTLQPFAVRLPFSGAGAGASPHQGGIVETQNGDWYYMAFNDSYPGGRIPVLAPMTWSNGWPSVTLAGGAWGGSYPFPNLPCGAGRVRPPTGTDTFSEATLRHEWEWNHNPDRTRWSTGSGLSLQTASVTDDLYAARNTLTRRVLGPTSTATIELDFSTMQDGDVAGIAALRDASAYIGVKRSASGHRVVMVNDVNLDSSWNTSSTGTEEAGVDLSGSRIWLRIAANIRTDAGGGQARFYYSTDGSQFTELGGPLSMKRDWQFFLGYRYAIFNFATQGLGGGVTVNSFELATP
ncbi:MAG: glycoside hydrolase 43 family protein [Polyangiaceae bacterium]|nr:glycoside hydrolase 43 family protein [Polyangiaceae bacterium]